MKVKRMAMAWLREEDWSRWLELDPQFQPDYQHWLKRMNAMYAELQAKGINVVKVEVLPDEFLQWASAVGCGTDTNARAGYAAMKAQAMDLH